MSDELRKQFELLKNIIRCSETAELSVDLSEIESIIFHELPNELGKNAPANFPDLYFQFKMEYERFKSFILYDKLIGKNIVALGGGFSSGKSTFLNSLLGRDILPSDITPSTSVPAYLVYGKEYGAYGINTFESKVDMDIEDVAMLSHGFGKSDGSDKEVTLGHLLSSVFLSMPEVGFKNLVLLDTPGYSKAETAEYSAKTDEKIAKAQLNSANFIMWFVTAESGTISQSDIDFIKGLNENVPKLIIVNKADKIMPSELREVVEKIKETLDMKAVKYLDILTYSAYETEDYQRNEIISYMDSWNKTVSKNRFAYNFKVLFTKCREYYDEKLDEVKKLHSRLSHILADTSLENDDARDYLNFMYQSAKKEMAYQKELKEKLKTMQNKFFGEIKAIADKVHIEMPEPSEIDLIQDRITDPKAILDEYCEKKGLNTQKHISARQKAADMIESAFMDIKPVFNSITGTMDYQSEIAAEMESILKAGTIRFNDCMKYNTAAVSKILGGS